MRASARRSRVRGRVARLLAEHRAATCASLLYDVVLSQWPAAQVARVRKRREVDGTVFSESDEFGERTADCRRVLQPVTAEAACENQVGHGLACAQERILIEDVVVVMSQIGACHSDGLERGYAMRQ